MSKVGSADWVASARGSQLSPRKEICSHLKDHADSRGPEPGHTTLTNLSEQRKSSPSTWPKQTQVLIDDARTL